MRFFKLGESKESKVVVGVWRHCFRRRREKRKSVSPSGETLGSCSSRYIVAHSRGAKPGFEPYVGHPCTVHPVWDRHLGEDENRPRVSVQGFWFSEGLVLVDFGYFSTYHTDARCRTFSTCCTAHVYESKQRKTNALGPKQNPANTLTLTYPLKRANASLQQQYVDHPPQPASKRPPVGTFKVQYALNGHHL